MWKILKQDELGKFNITFLEDKGILVLDMKYLPDGMTINEFIQLLQDQKVIERIK